MARPGPNDAEKRAVIEQDRLANLAKAKDDPRELHRALALQEELIFRETASLPLYEPMPFQLAFHQSKAPARIIRKGNGAGGTLASAVELARAALRCDPYNKYRNDPTLTFWIIGWGEDHIGDTFHRVLFEPGAFKIIRDEITGVWRVYNPQRDLAREGEAVPAPPLIPERYFEGEPVWGNKGARQFDIVRLKTGASIHAFTSGSKMPPMGSSVHGIWIDEDISQPYWVPEMVARFRTVNGRLWWSAAPLTGNDVMVNLTDMAEEEREKKRADPTHKPICEEFHAITDDNKYISEEELTTMIAMWRASGGEEEVTKRRSGDYNLGSTLMYPSFTPGEHCIDAAQYGEWDMCKGWCRYVSIDPGHTVCCLLFGAVSPKNDLIVIEKVRYIHKCSAEMFGETMKKECAGKHYHAFIIDTHGSAPTEAGSGLSIRTQYQTALRDRGIRSQATGSGFAKGSTAPTSRAMAVRAALESDGETTPALKIFAPECSELISNFTRFRKKIDKSDRNLIHDEPDPRSRLRCHAMASLEYLIAAQPRWNRPRKIVEPREKTWAEKEFAAWKKEEKQTSRDNYVALGPVA